MRAEEQKKSGASERAILREEVEVIVMHFDRIQLHAWGAKVPSVIKVGATPGADRRLQFPLRQRGLPEIQTDVLGIDDILRPTAQIFTLPKSKEHRHEEEESEQTARTRHPPENSPHRLAQRDQAEDRDHDQTDARAQITAAAPRQGETDVTNQTSIANEHFPPDRPTAPTEEADAEDTDDFNQTSEVIRADVKSARAPPVVEPLQKRNEHEVIPVAKLQRADAHLHQRD